MGLALCHTLPRDQLMRFSVVLMVTAFILILIMFGEHETSKLLGSFKLNGRVVAELNGYRVRFPGVPLNLCPRPSAADIVSVLAQPEVVARFSGNSSGVLQDIAFLSIFVANGTLPSAATDACDKYERYTKDAAIAHITGGVLMFVCTLVIALLIVPCASTTTKMVLMFWLCILLPFALSVAGTAVFDDMARDKAEDFLRAAGAVPSGSELKFKFGFGFNLAIASTALLAAAFAIATFRLVHVLLLRPGNKQSVISRKDIGGLMQLHLVNDDWVRQKKLWAMHAQQVECDIVVVADQPTAGAAGAADAITVVQPEGQTQQQQQDGDAKPRHRRSLSIRPADEAMMHDGHGGSGGSGATRGSDEPQSPVFVHRREGSFVTDEMVQRRVAKQHDDDAAARSAGNEPFASS